MRGAEKKTEEHKQTVLHERALYEKRLDRATQARDEAAAAHEYAENEAADARLQTADAQALRWAAEDARVNAEHKAETLKTALTRAQVSQPLSHEAILTAVCVTRSSSN